MFENTGTLSFTLYGGFILLTIIGLIFAINLIVKGTIETTKLDKIIELFKYAIVTVAIATVATVISDLFKERDQDLKELEHFHKYVEDVKKADGIYQRLQLSKYLSIVAPSGAMKKSWEQYYDTVQTEYKEYLLLKKQEQKLDTIKFPTEQQNKQKEQIQEEINKKESPMVSYRKSITNDLNSAKIWEERGFEFLLRKDVNNAINAFTESENSYNKFHQVYEISEYLRANKIDLMNPNSQSWPKVYSTILTKYSWGMPETMKEKFKEIN